MELDFLLFSEFFKKHVYLIIFRIPVPVLRIATVGSKILFKLSFKVINIKFIMISVMKFFRCCFPKYVFKTSLRKLDKPVRKVDLF